MQQKEQKKILRHWEKEKKSLSANVVGSESFDRGTLLPSGSGLVSRANSSLRIRRFWRIRSEKLEEESEKMAK